MRNGTLDINVGGGGGAPVASQAEAEAGSNNTKVMTPLRVAQAVEALAPGGGLVLNDVVFVDSIDGSDGAGDGTAAAPWATIQKAYNEGRRNMAIRGAAGNLMADGLNLHLMGYGRSLSSVGAISASYGDLFCNGKHMIQISSIMLTGASGYGGLPGSTEAESGAAGGNGSDGPSFELRGAYVENFISNLGGAGGGGGSGQGGFYSGGSGGSGANGGNGGAVMIYDSHVAGNVSSVGGHGASGGGGGSGSDGWGGGGGNGGNGGNGGTITLVRSWAGYVITTPGGQGNGGVGGSGGSGFGSDGSGGMAGWNGSYNALFSEIAVVGADCSPGSVHFSMIENTPQT